MDLQALKTRIADVMPILDTNLNAAYREWMAGNIGRGAFEHVRARHRLALDVLASDSADPEQTYRACTFMTIDVRSGIRDMPDKAVANDKMISWLWCFHEAGFTETHPFFDVPTTPGGRA